MTSAAPEGAILVVEDDEDIAALERDYLEAEGFKVEVEQTGTGGMTRALSGSFDLILLDLMLPGVDGMEICRTLRSHLDVPIIIVTARSDDSSQVKGLSLGADDYIEKPFSPSVLVARVKAHLGRYRHLTGADAGWDNEVIEAKGVRLERGSRRVFVNDKEVFLRVKEFELLAFLMRNEGIVFDRDVLYDKVWGIDAVGDGSTVVVHIKRLRDKLNAHGDGAHLIETIRGAGYRFA